MAFETLKVCKAMVAAVDKTKWTCTVIGEDLPPTEDVPINPILIGKDGNGAYYLPEVGSTVWVGEIAHIGTFILMGCALPFEGEDEPVDGDNSMGRHQAEPGDFIINGIPGSSLAVRGSGVIEIGASPIAKRFYIPVQNFVRDFCKAYEMLAAGGKLSFGTREGDTRFGTITENVITDPTSPTGIEEVTVAKVPTKFELKIKEFAQDKEPVIELQMGRVELDAEVPLIGGLNWRDIVFEMQIHDPKSVPEQDGTQKAGSVRILMDKLGGMNSCFFGSRFTKVHETETLNCANYTRTTSGLDKQSAQSRVVEIEKMDSLTVKGLTKRSFLGGMDIKLAGNINFDLSSPVSFTTGERTETVKGSLNTSVLGSAGMDCSRNYEVSVGGESKQISGGPITLEAGNKINPKPTGMLLKTYGGRVKIESFPGNGAVPYATGILLTTKGGDVVLDDTGSMYLRNKLGRSNIQITKTGVQMSTQKGAISIGQSGEINLGGLAQGGGAGNGRVVTTVTHPFCFVTGLPIKGSDVVSALSNSPIGVPGPHIPVVPYVDVMAAAEAAIATASAADILT